MADRLFQLQIISPDRVFYQGEVEMVEMNTTEGEIGVYASHIPMTSILVPHVLTITEKEGTKNAALHSGFVEILGDKVIVLAESVEWPNEIDINRANEAKIRAERRLKGQGSGEEVNVMRAEMALKRSLIRIQLAEGSRK